MCTLVILRRPGHAWPVIVGANRDEMQQRPWRPPGRHWPDRPDVVGGLDELAGGSWFGLNDYGVVAGILNRWGTLGPEEGRRSRGELVLEALDHADAAEAAAALRDLEPRAYRPFNLIVADNRDAFWLRHADAGGATPVEARPLPPGLSMIAAGDLNDTATPRLRAYLPRFRAAPPPDPATGDWSAWEALLGSRTFDTEVGPGGAMTFEMENGFATVSTSLVALPANPSGTVRPVFRFATRRPAFSGFKDVLAE
jgi:Transport and Golgi organisation 2